MADMDEETKRETERAEREERRQAVLKKHQDFIDATIQKLDLTKDKIDASNDAELKEWLARRLKGVTERLAHIENEKDSFRKDAKDSADHAKKLERQIADLKNRKGDLFNEVLGAMKEDHERDLRKRDDEGDTLRVALQKQEGATKDREDTFKAEKAKLQMEIKDQQKRAEDAEAAYNEQKESIKELEKTRRELEKKKQEVLNINERYDILQVEKSAVAKQLNEARVGRANAQRVASDVEAQIKSLEEHNKTYQTQLESLMREKNDLEESLRGEISDLQEKIREIERESEVVGSRRGSNEDHASTRAGENALESLEFDGNASQTSLQSDEENEGSQGGRSEGGASRKSEGEATRRLEEQLREKEGELARTKENATALENQLQQLKEKEGKLANAMDEIADLEEKVRQVQEKEKELDGVQESIAPRKDELNEKDEELIKVQQNAASLEDEVREPKEKEEELAKVQGNVIALKGKVQRLKENKEELAKEQQNIDSLKSRLRQFKDKDEELGKAKSNPAALRGQPRQLQESVAKNNKDIEQKDAEIARLTQELEKCQRERDDLKEQVDALTKQVLGANNARASLDSLQKDLESRRDDLESQVRASKEQKAAKQVEIDRLQGEVEKLQGEVDQLKKSVDTQRERADTNNAELWKRRDEIAQLRAALRQANEEVEKLQTDLQEARERAAPGAGNTGTGAMGQDVAAAEAFFNAKMADFAGQLDRLRESYEGDRDLQDLRDAVAASGARAETMFPEMARRLDGFIRSTGDYLNDMFHDVRGNGSQALRDRLEEMRDRLGRVEHFRNAYRAKLDGGEAGADAEQLQAGVEALTASAATLREQIQKLEEFLQALEAKQREWPAVEGNSSRSFQITLEQIELARQAEEVQVAGLQAGIRMLEDELASKAGQAPSPPPQDELLRLQGELDQARSDFQAVQDEAGQFVGEFVARLTDLSTLAREQITGRLNDQIDEFQNQIRNQPSAETASDDRLESQALAELLHDQRQWAQDVMEAADAMRTRAANQQFAHQGTQTDLTGDAGGFRFAAGGETWYSRHNVRVGGCCEGDWLLRTLNSLAFLFMIATVIAETRQYNAWRNGNAVTRALYMAADDNMYCLRTPNYDWFFEWLATLLSRR
ncbi:hypothetical protein DL766_002506 [Monosporascus sp. MC13-8B]|uniref:Uncharacterized protein n=1 Tax=Monosporascus cannonballus TaxID=155416 RepID=A0ABY0H050_9PEZI|nr:hypothetical protein DL762_007224 [Monosporascus cannonballus]RYP35495.1 hypothetical protein DL766_002506 [Monosporascus sp. MC13-8B]